MKISKPMEEALNGQINAELYSSYMYLGMSGYLESENYSGFAHWMKIQAQEELLHAMKIFEYVNDRGGTVVLKAIEEPANDWKSPLKAFEAAYAHEQKVTAMINALVDKADAEKDHATSSFLRWFVDEQVEEEATSSGIVEKLRMMGDAKGALIMYDRGLGRRPEKLVEAKKE